jgi:hypothetical protein
MTTIQAKMKSHIREDFLKKRKAESRGNQDANVS